MKEGEESLAKLGDGNDDEFAWKCHGGCGLCVRYGEGEERNRKMEERVERKWEEVRESESGECCHKWKVLGF